MQKDISPPCLFTIIPSNNKAPIESVMLEMDTNSTVVGDQIPQYLKSISKKKMKNESIPEAMKSYYIPKFPCEIEVTTLLRTSLTSPSSLNSIGIYAYSYINLIENNQKSYPNVRATTLAMSMGLHHQRFYGDVYIGKVYAIPGGLSLRNASVEKEEIEACSFSPDLRLGIINGLATSSIQIPDWLGNSMRENYRDGSSLVQLAKVMGLKGGDNDRANESFDDEESDENDSDDDRDDNDDHSHESEEICQLSPTCTKNFFDTSLCIHCRGPTSSLCKECFGAYFCDSPRNCQQSGWSHLCLCSTWKIYIQRRDELSTFPFNWHHNLINPPNFLSEKSYKEFLIEKELFNQGWWKTELGGWWASTQKAKVEAPVLLDPNKRYSFTEGFGKYLEEKSLIPTPMEWNALKEVCMEVDPNTNLIQIHSWENYYKIRNISLSSPVALLLTFPMTMYYAIQQHGAVPLVVSKMLRRPMRMHVVGIEKELNFLDMFQEVGFLLPDEIQLELVFVVRKDMLPSQYKHDEKDHHSKHCNDVCIYLTSNVELRIVAGTYGSDLDPNFDCGTGPPDMILGMNAGIYAYDSWRSVVQYLDNHPSVVGVFTDYNEHSAVNCAGSLGGRICRESVSMNPFRQPRAMPVRCMNLPQFSNGFMYVCNEQELDI